MKHNLHNTNVIVTSLSSITEFYVMKESNLQILEKLQNDLNTEDTLTESRAMMTKKFVPDVGHVILAKFPFDSKYYRGIIIEHHSGNLVKVSFFDFGNTSVVDRSSLLPLPEAFRHQEPLAVRCAMFGAYSVKDQTKDLFKELVVGRSLILQVMKEDFQKKLLEVDLIREEEDDVKFTSVRDCLVFIGGAEFETNPFAIVPNEKHHQFEVRKLLKPESEHEVFLSHIADPSPGKNVHVYVQVFPTY